MDIETLTAFLGVCTLIHAIILISWWTASRFAPGFLYGLIGKAFHITQEKFSAISCTVFLVYRVLFAVFSAVPFVALLIIS